MQADIAESYRNAVYQQTKPNLKVPYKVTILTAQ